MKNKQYAYRNNTHATYNTTKWQTANQYQGLQTNFFSSSLHTSTSSTIIQNTTNIHDIWLILWHIQSITITYTYHIKTIYIVHSYAFAMIYCPFQQKYPTYLMENSMHSFFCCKGIIRRVNKKLKQKSCKPLYLSFAICYKPFHIISMLHSMRTIEKKNIYNISHWRFLCIFGNNSFSFHCLS